MAISREVVDYVARLAHVGLCREEIDALARELSGVLRHVEILHSVDTSDVTPTAQVTGAEGVMREDVVTPSWPVADVLANAPHRLADAFEVQAILD